MKPTRPIDEELAVLRRFIEAHERADVAVRLDPAEDVRQAVPAPGSSTTGEAVATRFARYLDPDSLEYPGNVRLV